MKICINITHHQGTTPNTLYIERVIAELQTIKADTTIFVHTNKNYTSTYKNVHTVLHNIEHVHPYYLTWRHRHFLLNHCELYDVYVYLEDDILFRECNLHYWLNFNNLLKSKNCNVGFIRLEVDNKNIEYAIDVPNKNLEYRKDLLQTWVENIEGKQFMRHRFHYCGFWILDSEDFNIFKQSEHFTTFKNTKVNINTLNDTECVSWNHFIRECAAFGDRHFFNKKSVLHINNNVIDTRCKVYHISNKYITTRGINRFAPYNKFYEF